MPTVAQHEVGHLVHHRLPPDVDVGWRRLHERSVLATTWDGTAFAIDLDTFHCLNPGYAADRATEDFAEHVRAFFGDQPHFLARAVHIARETGKTLLLEKYLVLAGAFSRGVLGGSGAFPVLEAVRTEHPWSEGGGMLTFVDHGSMAVSRDEAGRIDAIEGGGVRYTFGYSGDTPSVSGVETLPPAGDALFADDFEWGDPDRWTFVAVSP
jgi:hypothetical protein